MKKITQNKLDELLENGARRRGYKSYQDVDKTVVRGEIYDEAQMSLQSFRDYLSQKHRKDKKKR